MKKKNHNLNLLNYYFICCLTKYIICTDIAALASDARGASEREDVGAHSFYCLKPFFLFSPFNDISILSF